MGARTHPHTQARGRNAARNPGRPPVRARLRPGTRQPKAATAAGSPACPAVPTEIRWRCSGGTTRRSQGHRVRGVRLRGVRLRGCDRRRRGPDREEPHRGVARTRVAELNPTGVPARCANPSGAGRTRIGCSPRTVPRARDTGDRTLPARLAAEAGPGRDRAAVCLEGDAGRGGGDAETARTRETGPAAVPVLVSEGTRAVRGAREASVFPGVLEQVAEETRKAVPEPAGAPTRRPRRRRLRRRGPLPQQLNLAWAQSASRLRWVAPGASATRRTVSRPPIPTRIVCASCPAFMGRERYNRVPSP